MINKLKWKELDIPHQVGKAMNRLPYVARQSISYEKAIIGDYLFTLLESCVTCRLFCELMNKDGTRESILFKEVESSGEFLTPNKEDTVKELKSYAQEFLDFKESFSKTKGGRD